MKNDTVITARGYRLRLLASVSAATLIASACDVSAVRAADVDRPHYWLELGWQFENVGGNADALDPIFTHSAPWAADGFAAPSEFQRLKLFSYGAEGAFSVQPDNSNWIFKLAARFGRSHGSKSTNGELPPGVYPYPPPFSGFPPVLANPRFAHLNAASQQTHAIIDFMAERDVGLGLLGRQGTSTMGLGLRFAQFSSRTSAFVSGDPDAHIGDKYFRRFHASLPFFHTYHIYKDAMAAERNFRGVGPEISWAASTTLDGDLDSGALSLDWGLNAALLFGKQNTKVSHSTITDYYHGRLTNVFPNVVRPAIHEHYSTGKNSNRSRTVTVPNVGGFAGISYRFTSAKLSVGYRADFFVHAIDGGIDTRRDVTRSFNGPFASISFGISPSDF